MKIAIGSEWKLDIAVEYIRKGMPQHQFTELQFADIARKARAMLVQANVAESVQEMF